MQLSRKFLWLASAILSLAAASMLAPVLLSPYEPVGQPLLHETFDRPSTNTWLVRGIAREQAVTNGWLRLPAPPRTMFVTEVPAPAAGTLVRWAVRGGCSNVVVGKKKWMYARADLVPVMKATGKPEWAYAMEPLEGKGSQSPRWEDTVLKVREGSEQFQIRLCNVAASGLLLIDEVRLEIVQRARPFEMIKLGLHILWVLLAVAVLIVFRPWRTIVGGLAMAAYITFVVLCLIPSNSLQDVIVVPLEKATQLTNEAANHARSAAIRKTTATAPKLEEPIGLKWDQLGHMFVLVAIAFLTGLWAWEATPRGGLGRICLLAALGPAAVSISSECLQNLTLVRSFQWEDLVADAVGIAVAVALLGILFTVKQRLQKTASHG